jgi:CheY-like chemotaxis protein
MGKRILLVDDEQGMREVVKLLLAEDSHTVVEANNGAEALDLFKRSRFDLVMTDFRIPFIRGDELAMAVRRLAPTQPILMITGYPESLGRDNPVDAILRKPFGQTRLRATVARLLKQPTLAQPQMS